MNGHSVEKIGGTSMAATATLFDNVLIAGRKGADLYNRIFVVSAYAGMTDLLLEHKKSGRAGVYARFVADEGTDGWREAIEEVRAAMCARNAEMFARGESRKQADAFVDRRIDAVAACLGDLARLRSHGRFCVKEQLMTVRELLAGLGEAHSAHSTALLLNDRGVNAVFVDLTLWDQDDMVGLDERIVAALEPIDLATTLPIVTGYAGCREGMVRRYARGYSEMTFSRIAVLTGAREAIIHKEFHLSSADPKLVGIGKARKIGRTNYDVADQLANLGMEAIHPGAGRGLRQTNIPLRVRNTFDREDGGTLICGDYVSDTPRVEIVTGIRRAQALQFFEQDMVGVKGYDAAILEALTRHGAWIVSKSSNANTITHYLSAEAATMKRVIEDLQQRYPDAAISAHPVAMVSVIGSDISRPSLVADALRALDDEGVGVIAMQHQIRNVDVQFIVDVAHYDAAVRALHCALVECDGQGAQEQRAA
ncbi:Aspartokinase associated with ectoine biosynthesis [Sphingobium herbicidovorans NBRC 16415]|uniref:aspartate kinase n=1 Tax=Sphingobium herbicidovorans (strain ATCC 700291 / DSM 11019 / CCUG 56400 / KCTC 2939 / LMG 18315 / NBRC 16415 / MH) TaxID=1219045 RepID=A0A086P6E5_SPHHM|nr:aspartate kinase [Sphingobium herbicidovorans]KFG88963.1 Aspartokinase associated with ectoine biosynthesis [Sphingobium herbicidovorans NBRC 16415]